MDLDKVQDKELENIYNTCVFDILNHLFINNLMVENFMKYKDVIIQDAISEYEYAPIIIAMRFFGMDEIYINKLKIRKYILEFATHIYKS